MTIKLPVDPRFRGDDDPMAPRSPLRGNDDFGDAPDFSAFGATT
jgi:hypothetical protein